MTGDRRYIDSLFLFHQFPVPAPALNEGEPVALIYSFVFSATRAL
jgi:hypothetical protein